MVGETSLLYPGSIGVKTKLAYSIAGRSVQGPKKGSLGTIFSELVLHTISCTNFGLILGSFWDSFLLQKAYKSNN